MADTHRVTFTVTPLTDAETQQVIDDLRARFGRKPLIHVIGRQPSNTPVDDAPRPGHPALPESCLVVLRDLAAGFTSKEIAARRYLTKSAVAMRIARANEHLGTSTAAQAVYEATVRGLLSQPTQEAASA